MKEWLWKLVLDDSSGSSPAKMLNHFPAACTGAGSAIAQSVGIEGLQDHEPRSQANDKNSVVKHTFMSKTHPKLIDTN